MEYIYAVMLLNKAGKKIDEKSVAAVLKAADVKVDDAKVKSLIAALDGVDIEKVIEESSIVAAPAQSGSTEKSDASSSAPAKEEKKEAPKVDAAAGLGSLF